MTNRNKSELVLLIAICLGICFVELFLIHRYVTPSTASRDVIVAELLKQLTPSASIEIIIPDAFCEGWGGRPSIDLDCRSGRQITSHQNSSGKDNQQLLERTTGEIKARIEKLQTLRTQLSVHFKKSPELTPVVEALDTRLARLQKKLDLIATEKNSASIADTSENYRIVFDLLLDLEGQTYQGIKGNFRMKRWDIAQILAHPDEIIVRGLQLKQALAWISNIVVGASLVLLLLAYWRTHWIGLGCMTIYLTFSLLGLLLTADAAVHFGETSAYFPFNPLGNQLFRQLTINASGYALLALMLIAKPLTFGLLRLAMRHPFLTTWVIAIIVLGTYAQSPAIGSELLKLGVALLAGINMTDQGRVVHLIRKYAPEVFSLTNLRLLFQSSTVDRDNPVHRVLLHIAKPLLNFCIFGLVTLGAASLAFNDLGGALISTLMMITALFLAFGSRPTWVVLLLLSISAALLSFTDKLQGRIDLMLAPMSASVSDFARLLAYSEASKLNGFGLGQLAWCNQEGTCLPIQVLSDYIPTVLNGIAGPYGTLLIFLSLCSFFIAIAGVSCWRFMTQQGIGRLIGVVTFFLLMASIIQTLLTFLGNWRFIPLTGVGAPLLSIGLSSILAPTLALGLFLTSSTPPKRGVHD